MSKENTFRRHPSSSAVGKSKVDFQQQSATHTQQTQMKHKMQTHIRMYTSINTQEQYTVVDYIIYLYICTLYIVYSHIDR